MRALANTVMLSLIVLLAGCAGGTKQVTSVDAAAIKLAVGGVIQAFSTAVAARDSAAIDSLYSDDAVLFPAHMPRVEGREGIHRWWAAGLTAPGLELALVPQGTTVAQAGDLAVVIGSYDYRTLDARGEAQHEVGKFVNVLKPERDRWRIVLDAWNSDAPPPAPGK